jgi:hypothetical protein
MLVFFLSSCSTITEDNNDFITMTQISNNISESISTTHTQTTSKPAITNSITSQETAVTSFEYSTDIQEDENINAARYLFDALIKKDAEMFVCCDMEVSNEQIFNLTQIESYEIISTEIDNKRSIYTVNITADNNSVFPDGESAWIVIFYDGVCEGFIPYDTDLSLVYSYTTALYDDPRINTIINFCYSMNSMQNSHNSFETINDFDDYFNDNIMTDETFIYDLACFTFALEENHVYYDDGCIYDYKTIESTINENFVCNLDLGDDEETFSGQIWKRFDDIQLHFIVNEVSDDYIDITFYADTMLLVPAKQIRYNFSDVNSIMKLKNTEVLVDYGFNPCFKNPLI